mmetsp:Transcript_16006/g.44314  ORF Transcript_16006/g.44314 Transcript_16006/m.44314 type:complete len:255 (-) Transcript_16006:424-1188(-)
MLVLFHPRRRCCGIQHFLQFPLTGVPFVRDVIPQCPAGIIRIRPLYRSVGIPDGIEALRTNDIIPARCFRQLFFETCIAQRLIRCPKSRPKNHSVASHGHHARHGSAIADTAGRKHRDPIRRCKTDDPRRQWQRPASNLAAQSMPASLAALRDDGIDSAFQGFCGISGASNLRHHQRTMRMRQIHIRRRRGAVATFASNRWGKELDHVRAMRLQHLLERPPTAGVATVGRVADEADAQRGVGSVLAQDLDFRIQ